jgi:triphosphoribosyl-dephospho-CoA synthase
MFKSKEDAALAAVLSMLLEVSGNPKAGNIDREHDFADLKYEHFLASSVSAYPVFNRAAAREGKMGELVLEAVRTTSKWHLAKNVHFGAFLLLIPLLYSWKEGNARGIAKAATEELKRTDAKDSLAVFKAFRISQARAMEVERLSLNSEETAELLRKNNINLYEWMLTSPPQNLIASELTNCFKISIKGKDLLLNFAEKESINLAIVLTYHSLLSEYPDPLVISKHGANVANEIKDLAQKALNKFEISRDLACFKELDLELVKRKINPGTIADLTVSSIFLALAEGLRF